MPEKQALDESCFTNYDNQCPTIDILTQESLTGPDMHNKLIKLRFTDILSRDQTPIIVTECYDINSIFRYVFGQIYNNQYKEPITPLRKVLSKAQINRIRQCYFSQPESQREWKNMKAFQTEMARITEIRNQDEINEFDSQYANEAENSDSESENSESSESESDRFEISNIVTPSELEEAIVWLRDRYPGIELYPDLEHDLLDDTLYWLAINLGLRHDGFTMIELLNHDVLGLGNFLHEKYGGLVFDRVPL